MQIQKTKSKESRKGYIQINSGLKPHESILKLTTTYNNLQQLTT